MSFYQVFVPFSGKYNVRSSMTLGKFALSQGISVFSMRTTPFTQQGLDISFMKIF